jgi:hypothetical protein
MQTLHQQQSPPRTRALQFLGIVNLAVPVLLFVLIAIRTSVNIPYEDDYDAIGEFLEHYISLHGAGARLWWVLTAQHVQYKDMVMQAVIAFQYQCTHRLNYRALQYWGDLSQLATVVVLWLIFARSGRPLAQRAWLFSIPCYLVLSLRYAETINWAMSGLQNIAVILFAVLTVLLATSTRRGSFIGCLISLALTIASSANGFLIGPLVLFLFLYARRFRDATWSVAVTLAMGALYAYHYTFINAGHPVPFWFGVKSLIAFPFVFLGAAADSVSHACIVGVLLVVGFIFLTWRGWLRVCPASFGAALFCILTACLVASGRFRFGAGDAAKAGHYVMYSVLLASLEYIAVVRLFAPRSLHSGSPWHVGLVATGFAAFLFCLVSDLHGYRMLRIRQKSLITHLILWERHPDHLVLVPDEGLAEQQPSWIENRERFQQDMQREVAIGLYVPPYSANDPLPMRTHSPSSRDIENEGP